MIVMITGTSSGLGQAMARHLASRGHEVIGAALEDGLDVRDDESVARFVARAPRIDALVNNAGFALAGAIEETSIEEAKAQFETNFFGVARMVKAVLPLFRAQGHGRIVNVSSGAALASGPFHGYYSASKWAVEGFTEALRHELRPFGIHVSILAPGAFRTNVVKNGKLVSRPLPEYDAPRGTLIDAMTHHCAKGSDPGIVARVVEKILLAKKPKLRYRAGKDVTASYWCKRFLPEAMYQKMVRDYYRVR